MTLIHLTQRYKIVNKTVNFLFTRLRLLIIIYLIISLSIQVINAQNDYDPNQDLDKDGISNQFDTDDDGDGYSDDAEIEAGTNPLDPLDHPSKKQVDTDGDNIPDVEDLDDDNDGLSDIKEVKLKTNATHIDTDEDRLLDYREVKLGTNPLVKDTDSDGFLDGDEVFAKTDPLDKKSFPISVIANAGLDQIAFPNESVVLDGLFSIGKNLSYSWDFDLNDGIQINSIENKTEHAYTNQGIFIVTLNVTNGITSDTDTCTIIVDSALAASMDIVKNRQTNSINYQKDIKLNLSSRTNNSIIIEIEGNLSNAIIALTLDSYTMLILENNEIMVKFDSLTINHTDLIGLVTSKGEDAVYNISTFYNGMQIIIYIPHFSKHNIVIEKIEKIDKSEFEPPGERKKENLYFWLLVGIIILGLVISFAYTYSYLREKEKRYYKELKIDDDSKRIFQDTIELSKTNWEEYDSEK